uniref:Uncharacterized protein n=1 Tax=Anopheles stephensi TaxID=30069 RepID=A0A182YQ78_ANOST
MPNQEEEKPSTSGMTKVNVAMSMIGHMEPFMIGENFDEYVSRPQLFFIVNDVEETKKVPMLVTMAGPSLYSIANRICSPEDPCSKTCKNQIELLKQHLSPKVNVMAERCKYHKCEQATNQTITEFIIELKALSQSSEGDLTFEKACEIGRSWEASEQECREMKGPAKLAAFKQRTSWKSSDRTAQGIEIINAFVVVEIIAPRPVLPNNGSVTHAVILVTCHRCVGRNETIVGLLNSLKLRNSAA